jgi:hypothetical protein
LKRVFWHNMPYDIIYLHNVPSEGDLDSGIFFPNTFIFSKWQHYSYSICFVHFKTIWIFIVTKSLLSSPNQWWSPSNFNYILNIPHDFNLINFSKLLIYISRQKENKIEVIKYHSPTKIFTRFNNFLVFISWDQVL